MHSFPLARLFALSAALLAAGPSAVAAGTIYRWTDDQGRTHYSEVVPEQYRATAKPVSPGSPGPTPEQLREAQARAARDKARAADIRGDAPSAPPASASAAASAPAARRPERVPDDRTDCDTWARLYKESIDCFGPFRTARGATREEAFAYCTPVSEPPTRCRKRVP
jgi:hypothetical protein